MASDTAEPGRRRPGVGTLVALFTILMLAVVAYVVVDASTHDERGPGDAELTATQREGRRLFVENCSQCHALEHAGAVQTVGPDLDELRPPRELVLNAIEQGRAGGAGQMPANLVVGDQAEAVADYVTAVAGRGG
jgi:mono/diheme cytochrome c family protein